MALAERQRCLRADPVIVTTTPGGLGGRSEDAIGRRRRAAVRDRETVPRWLPRRPKIARQTGKSCLKFA